MNSENNNPFEINTSSGSNISRRQWITRMGIVPFASMISANVSAKTASPGLPAKERFAVKGTYINAAFTHPMSITTAEAARGYIKRRLDCDRAADEDMNV